MEKQGVADEEAKQRIKAEGEKKLLQGGVRIETPVKKQFPGLHGGKRRADQKHCERRCQAADGIDGVGHGGRKGQAGKAEDDREQGQQDARREKHAGIGLLSSAAYEQDSVTEGSKTEDDIKQGRVKNRFVPEKGPDEREAHKTDVGEGCHIDIEPALLFWHEQDPCEEPADDGQNQIQRKSGGQHV